MAITNLTGQKTSKTFKNLMQISSSGQVFDGLGNLVTFLDLPISIETGSFATTGSNTFINNQIVSGSLTVTQGVSGSFTGSLFGTASYAATASNILGGKAPHIPFFITDTTLATSSLYQSGSGTVIINQDNATTANPEALYVWQPHPTSINVISGKGNINNYLQLNIQNTNQGTAASSDVVATANNGNETTNYIDMGINSENYNSGFIGNANDAYLYSTGLHLHIGNASDEPVMFFAGGTDVDMHNKLLLNPNNQHELTGSLEISGSLKVNQGITGSLFGTASYVSGLIFTDSNQALTASYALTASHAPRYVLNSATSSFVLNSQTGSFTTTSSFNSFTGSYNTGSFTGSFKGILTGTASLALNANSSSTSISASYADNANFSLTTISASYALQANTATTANYANTAGNGGVTSIIAGSGIILPFGGTGNVTIVAAGGGGVTIISGSAVTSSFTNLSTWTFNHNLGTRTPTITVFDSNYNQVIPENIQLVNTASATITFPTLESGFAIASTGGTTSTALSSSYSLFATYANSASYYPETDPIFVAKSGSLATTGSNRFIGNQIVTGSLVVSSSNSITVIGPMTITGSLLVSGSTTQIGNNTLTGTTSLTGSISVSGSQTFVGNNSLTGSLSVTGSTLQTGNNTLIGNTVLSGSLEVSGSQVFKGDFDLTGSLTVTGSTVQIGNNTLTGNTVLSGSLEVSGSQTFRGTNTLVGTTSITGSFVVSGSTTNRIIGNTFIAGHLDVTGSSTFSNSTFTVTGSQFFTGSSFINGSQTITGNQMISGTLDVLGNINVISGSSFTRWGNKLFNYGAFSDYTTQSGSADTANPVTFNTTDVSLEVFLSGSSAIKILNKGIYNFQWSGQLHQGANSSIVSIWVRINGTDVPGSRGDVSLRSNDDMLPAWNYVLPFNANDAVELYWSSTSANTTWVYSPIQTNPPRPSTASILATLTQIA